MNLNRTPDPLNRSARNLENDNWDKIEGSIKRIDDALSDLVLESGGDSNLEVVQARGGKPVLNDRLNGIDTQLADTNSKVNNKRDKSALIKLDDVDEDFLGAMSGEGSFDISSIPKDRSVDFSKTNNSLLTLLEGREYKASALTDWEHGSFIVSNGEPFEPPNTTRVRSTEFLPVKKETILSLDKLETFKFAVYIYDKEKNFINNFSFRTMNVEIESDCHVKLIVAYEDDREIDESEISELGSLVTVTPPKYEEINLSRLSENIIDMIRDETYNVSDVSAWENGAIQIENGRPFQPPNPTRMRMRDFLYLQKGDTIQAKSNFAKFAVYLYDKNSQEYQGYDSLSTSSYTTVDDVFVKLIIGYENDREITKKDYLDLSSLVEIIPAKQTNKIKPYMLSSNLINMINGESYNISDVSLWENGGMQPGNGRPFQPPNPTRMRMRDFFLLQKGDIVKVVGNAKYSIYFYDKDNYEFISRETFTTSSYTLENDCFVKVVVAYLDDKEIEEDDFVGLSSAIEITHTKRETKNNATYRFTDTFGDLFTADTVVDFTNPVDVQTSEIYSRFDELVNDYSDYVDKVNFGKANEDIDMYYYRFTSINLDSDKTIEKPTIVITTGTHGDEKGSVYSTYNFFKQLCDNWRAHKALEFLRFNVNFIVIPIVNPTGFNEHKRSNINDIDLNRDFPNSGIGTESYDNKEPETKNILQLMEEIYEDVDLWVDYHNMYFRDGYTAYATGRNDLVNEVMNRTIQTVSREWQKEYSFFPQDENHKFGYTINGASNTITSCVNASGMRGMTLEIIRETKWQSNSSQYDELTIKLGLELLVNSIINTLKSLSS